MKALHFRRWACAIVVMGTSAMGAQNQTIYRCGTSYSDTPCAQAVTVSTADPRSAEQKAQTDEATHRAAGLAGQMEKTRRADEAAAQQRTASQALAASQAAKAAPKAPLAEVPEKAQKGGKHKVAVGAGTAAEKVRKPALNKPQKPEGFTIKVPAPAKAKAKS